jgi:Carboxypeptidase regulatory-like domain/TonB dependent receptor
MSLRRVALLAAPMLLASLVHKANGQTLYGSIVGNVTDTSKAAVPDAKVKLTQVETNLSHELVTNSSGAYVYNDAPPGTYRVVIAKEGFQTFNARDIVVQSNSAVRVDATLNVGTSSQTVEVTAEAAALQTDRADVHTEMTSQALENIPVSNRSYQSLAVLTPGVTQPSLYQTGGINNPTRSMDYNVNGTPNSDVAVRFDGISASNYWKQYLQAYTPAIEAIDTINMVSSSFDAEQGLAGGASVNIFIKSGTNQFHGSAFEYVTNADLRARGFFLPANQDKLKDDKNVFGGTVGGPIKRNKLFFFASWQMTRENSNGPSPYALQNGPTGNFLTLPNVTLRGGNFSQAGTNIYDPLTGSANGTGRTVFPGDAIPANRLSPSATSMLSYLPLPQTTASANNYFSLAEYNTVYQEFDDKINWNVSNKLNIYGRTGFAPSHEVASGYYPNNQGTTPNPLSLGGYGTGNIFTMSVGATYTISPTLIVDGVAGMTRQHTLQTPLGPNTCWGTYFGIANSCQPPGNRDTSLPNMVLTGFSSLGNTTWLSSVFDYLEPQYEGAANFTWSKGSHNIRFGADLHKNDINHSENSITTMTFTGGVTALNGGAGPNMYNSLADFLLGLPQSTLIGENTPPLSTADVNPLRPATLRTWEGALYVRDQWQVSRKLTVSWGLRWEYYPVSRRGDRGIEFFNFATDKVDLCGVGPNSKDCGIGVSPKLFAPRLGLAYRPSETLVIRTGFSLNYEQDFDFQSGAYNFPTVVTVTTPGANSYSPSATSFATGFNPLPTPSSLGVPSGVLSLPAGVGITTEPSTFVRGYIMSWNFTMQKSLPHNFVVQAGYVGTRAVHQVQSQNVNYGQLGGGVASQPYYQAIGDSATMNVLEPMNHTFYDALQVTLNRRFSSGLTISSNYSFSKSLSRFAGSIPIPADFRLNYGLNSIDVPNHFVFAASYQLPFGKGKPFLAAGGFVTALASGWQISTLVSAFSESPFTVTASATSLNAPGSSQRANQVLPNVQILGGTDPYFNPLAFAQPTCVCFGTSGYNILRGPFYFNWDQSLFRRFHLSERFGLEFRAEGFNIANTPHFANPAANVSSLQLNSAGQVANLNGFGVITTVNTGGRDFDERYFRLGMRLNF